MGKRARPKVPDGIADDQLRGHGGAPDVLEALARSRWVPVGWPGRLDRAIGPRTPQRQLVAPGRIRDMHFRLPLSDGCPARLGDHRGRLRLVPGDGSADARAQRPPLSHRPASRRPPRSAPPPVPRSAPLPTPPPDLATYAQIETQVEALRELAPKSPVTPILLDEQGVRDWMTKAMASGVDHTALAAESRLFAHLGLLPAGRFARAAGARSGRRPGTRLLRCGH